MPNSKTQTTSAVTKNMRYSVVTKVVNFNPSKYTFRTIIVNGTLAIRLKGNLYTKM
ncbi:MAG: hypothetical protein Q7S31_02445 [bacterium]|nr:hypothetical protein [bacterium]